MGFRYRWAVIYSALVAVVGAVQLDPSGTGSSQLYGGLKLRESHENLPQQELRYRHVTKYFQKRWVMGIHAGAPAV